MRIEAPGVAAVAKRNTSEVDQEFDGLRYFDSFNRKSKGQVEQTEGELRRLKFSALS